MISNQKAKYIKSLSIKKFRKKHEAFVVEGSKSVLELIKSDFIIELIVATNSFLNKYKHIINERQIEFFEISEDKLASLSGFTTNDSVLAVAKFHKNPGRIDLHVPTIVLDDVRDPGNLGTIIRTADWYGISQIIASPESADFYNPKVIQATMGSFTRVQVVYEDLEQYLGSSKNRNIYGGVLDGENIHDVEMSPDAIIILGNESNGVSNKILKHVTYKVRIPKFGNAESLNVAMSAAIFCDNYRRCNR